MSKKIYCGVCGKQITEKQAYCPYCGARNPAFSSDHSVITQKPKQAKVKKNTESVRNVNTKVLLSALAAVLVLFGMGAVIYNLPLSAPKADKIIHNDWNRSSSNAVLELDPDSEETPDFISEIENRASFKVVSAHTEKGVCTVVCEISSCDITGALKAMIEDRGAEVIDESQLDGIVSELIRNSPDAVTEAEVYIYRRGLKHTVVYSEEFFDAMYGGVISYYDDAFANGFYLDKFDEGDNNENQ